MLHDQRREATQFKNIQSTPSCGEEASKTNE